jgi:hypothetical protein
MKTKTFLLACSVLLAVMLVNISVTQNRTLKLNVKIGALQDADASVKEPVPSFCRWYMPGSGDPTTQYFGQLSCYQRFGWFELPTECSNY